MARNPGFREIATTAPDVRRPLHSGAHEIRGDSNRGGREELLASLALALVLTLSGCGAADPATPAPTTATAAQTPVALPTQPLTTLAGDKTDLGRVTEGRVALVSLWATWCDACTKEIDSLNRLAAKTEGRKDALVVGVAVGESPATVGAFTKRHAMSYLQLVDEEFLLADALGQRHVPAMLVIDRGGKIVYRGDALDAAGLAAFRGALGQEQPPLVAAKSPP
jgi:peroxiredoxin